MNQFSSNLHTVYGKKRKLLFLTVTAFFLFSFLTTNGQNPTVTINQSATQPDPANSSPINFTVLFDQPVIGFTTGDVAISGTAGGLVALVTGGPTLYNVSVSGMTTCGTVIANIPAGVCTNTLTQPNLASTSIDNTVTLLTGNPNVTINQAASQPDPTSASPINFTVQFDQVVTGFATGDVSLSGTAGATTGIVTGSGATYNVAVYGMTAIGTVIATIAAGVCGNACAQTNNASTGTDNTVTINCVPPVVNVTPAISCGGVAGLGCNGPLTASGNADGYVWSPLAGLYNDCQATVPYTGDSRTVVYAAPTANIIYTVTGTITATVCSATATTLVNYTPPGPIVIPPSVNMCLGDPAVKLRVASGNGFNSFCSGVISVPVPDNNPAGAFSSINITGIPGSCTVTGMNVMINMAHTRIGNMVFVLKAPNGQVLNLNYHLTATGGIGSTTGFNNTILSSTGTTSLSSGTNPYTGTFRADAQLAPAGGFGATGPMGMLPTTTSWANLFMGSVNGNWTLGFYDGVTGDVGTLTSWCLVINYSCAAIPATPAIWTPAAGLFADAASTVPYVAGTQVDSVWVRPTPAGVYPYQVTNRGVPALLCAPATNFTSNNGDGLVTFNVKNNHPFPIRLLQINSKTFTTAQTSVSVYYKTSAINGPPGFISAANGWNFFGGSSIAGNGAVAQPFLTNLQLTIPPGITYGICLRAETFTSVPNLAYRTLLAGNYSFNDGGCEIITGTNIGYSGNTNTPATPLSGFVGSVQFADASTTCISPARSVVVTVGQVTSITTQPLNKTVCVGNTATFTVGVAGVGPFTYQWQVSSNGGASYNNIVDGGVFAGTLTNMLFVTPTTIAMNGNLFRVLVNGGSGCTGATSAAALLTVNPMPTITITANPLVIGPGQTTTIFSTVTPNPAATYTWYYNGAVLPGATADTVLVDINGLGDYQLKVTDVNGCINLSNIITIVHSFALTLFTYPNPSAGIFQIRYYSEVNNALQRSLMVYNNWGERIITRSFTQTMPYQKIDIDIRAHGKGLYWIELRDAIGKRLAINRAVIQ